MYVNGMGFRAIERVTSVDHTTIIGWVKQVGNALTSTPQSEEIPEITQVDELPTFVGKKKNKVWVWTAVDKHRFLNLRVLESSVQKAVYSSLCRNFSVGNRGPKF